jgi:hypothetical protein
MHVTAPLLIAATAVGMPNQVSTTDVDALVDRMGRYLVEYETQLSTVVAKERYRQAGDNEPRMDFASDQASGILVPRELASATVIPPP